MFYLDLIMDLNPNKKGPGIPKKSPKPLFYMVATGGLEPPTPAL